MDTAILSAVRDTLESRKEISLEYAIANTDRSVGAMLSGAGVSRYGQAGLPDHTIQVKFKVSEVKSFGSFLAHCIPVLM